MAIKSIQVGDYVDPFMPICSADTLGFSAAISTKLDLEIQFVKNIPCPT